MKKYILTILLAFTFGTLFAQTYQMKVVKKSGGTIENRRRRHRGHHLCS